EIARLDPGLPNKQVALVNGTSDERVHPSKVAAPVDVERQRAPPRSLLRENVFTIGVVEGLLRLTPVAPVRLIDWPLAHSSTVLPVVVGEKAANWIQTHESQARGRPPAGR